MARHIVDSSFEGFNGTVFVYGQTASGKTFTMEGTKDDKGSSQRPSRKFFGSRPSHRYAKTEPVTVKMSYLEIYNEAIRDLLDPSRSSSIRIMQGLDSNTVVEGVKEIECKKSADAFAAMVAGQSLDREVEETWMNDHSSRSHAILTLVCLLFFGHHQYGNGKPTGVVKSSRLNLVDLAGSERAGLTGAEGQRLKESNHITSRCSPVVGHFQTVVRCGPRLGRAHSVPRLETHAHAARVVGRQCAHGHDLYHHPASTHVDESISTLKFAMRAKVIQNQPVLNMAAVTGKKTTEEDVQTLVGCLQERDTHITKLVEVNRKLEPIKGNWDSLQVMMRDHAPPELPVSSAKRPHDAMDTTIDPGSDGAEQGHGIDDGGDHPPATKRKRLNSSVAEPTSTSTSSSLIHRRPRHHPTRSLRGSMRSSSNVPRRAHAGRTHVGPCGHGLAARSGQHASCGPTGARGTARGQAQGGRGAVCCARGPCTRAQRSAQRGTCASRARARG
ncbi:P-loop containing nucleoside triphosphate hydrolase protein [Catenaria anguillulae PL171]|uniref:Kinesin-like protein n=1 Tax=Catenaria anguillulae PL171 TaxID=765915 RepID=A0A1Y2HAZ7_9FUNG|nr:P-loop containing nucleoside triphosphate hydrolase protein [Catenaria anguillulae PL171]